MKVIQPSFEVVTPSTPADGVEMLRNVERFARISHRSEDRQTEDTWPRFIKAVVMDKGDWSVTEHCVATVIVRVDRGVSHEWVRHRIGSYTQESTRFVNYGKWVMEFVEPSWPEPLTMNCSTCNKPLYKDGSCPLMCVDTGQHFRLDWAAQLVEAERRYLQMVNYNHISPQIARSLLPNALATTLAVTYNLRSWRQFFMMRTTKETHPDFRRVTIPMLKVFQERIPLLYDDIEPDQKQSISLSKPR